VSPALERYEQITIFGDLWRRPDLSSRDRVIVTLSALIARNQANELPRYLGLALDSGVEPDEIRLGQRHGGQLGGAGGIRGTRHRRRAIACGPADLLPLDAAAEARRAAQVAQTVRPVAPGLDQFTTDTLFHDLWLRPDLAARDRSLVTVSALIATGQVAQIPFHLNRAMDNGLTRRAQASEAVAHLAFYAGWPNAFSAAPVVKNVFDTRPN
jgi:4-carboxymuconolactone decarboxylase